MNDECPCPICTSQDGVPTRREAPRAASDAFPVVFTTTYTSNAAAIAAATSLYVHNGATIADVTFGPGAFWTKVDLSRFRLLKSDLQPRSTSGMIKADFTRLPYPCTSIDVLVLDPPYIHHPGKHLTDHQYNNAATTGGMDHADIINLYSKGMKEAWRVLKAGGQLWVKCKDEIESSKQKWSHMELYVVARRLGFGGKDMAIVTTQPPCGKRWKGKQRHLRKNHSYLWVFEKPKPRLKWVGAR